jgi:hypothetical protein
MSTPYKNPISAAQLSGPESVTRNLVQGIGFSVLNVGGYMEVWNVSDLRLTLTAATYPSQIQLSANTIPINFTKGTGSGIFGSGNSVSITATIPCQGLTAGTLHPAAVGLNAQAVFVGTQVSESVTANVTNITFATAKDTTGSWATNTYTVRVPGDYLVVGALIGGTASVYGNGTLIFVGATSAGGASSFSGVLHNCVYGDTITVRSQATATITNSDLAIYNIGTSVQPYAPRIAYIKDVKTSGTAGGTATSGSYQTRTLNNLTGDTSFISLASNQMTLQPGTYHIEANAPAHFVDEHKIKLRNVTNSSDTLIGSVEYSSNNFTELVGVVSRSILFGTVTISAATVFEIQHRVTSTSATSGFGIAASFGDSEVYTQVKITKVL